MGRGAKPGKAKGKAKPPIVRKAQKSEGARVRDLEKRLAEALGQLQTRDRELAETLDKQTATSDILRVISRSQTDVQPVFDAILASAVHLLGAYSGMLTRVAGDQLVLAALTGIDDAGAAAVRSLFPQPLQSLGPYARTMLDGVPFNSTDLQTDVRVPEFARAAAQARGFHSWVVVPLLRHDEAVGTISVTRREPGGFPDDEVALLKTFADQAVIAIENTRLFTELEARNRDLTESLEQQTATSEILHVISGSLTEVQPVFDAIVAAAVRLCGARYGTLYRRYDDTVDCVAHMDVTPDTQDLLRRAFPRPVTVGTTPHFQRALLHGAVTSIPDIEADAELTPRVLSVYRRHDTRSVVMVPLMRQTAVMGVLVVGHDAVRAFTESHVELLKTFADQAVIAIENVRLFTELQQKNVALTQAHAQVSEALNQQTATSEILRAMSGSLTDVQPVFDAIVRSGLRLLGGYSATMMLLRDGDCLDLVAHTSISAEADASLVDAFPLPLRSLPPLERAVRDRRPHAVEDVESDPDVTNAMRETGRARGWHSNLLIPMIREDVALGLISITRRAPGPFAADEIALLETFAAQAVIAIENVRLFKELEVRTQDLTRSVGELRALGDVGQAISSTLDLQTVLSTIVARATQLSDTDAGVIYEYDEQREVFVPRATEHLESEIVNAMLATPVRKGEGATGRLAEAQEPIQVPDVLAAPAESRVRGVLVGAGYQALLAVPLVCEGHLLGGLTVIRKTPGAFTPEVIELLQTFATQSALAIQNARLFQEIEAKSRELQVASQHKSEFLANMSHELRTPLNAIIGYSELLEEDAADLDGGRLVPDLQKIASAAKHQLSLINDILDLSKVEAGRMELELADFDLPHAIESALILVREGASRRGIGLESTIDERLGLFRGDERKVKQVLLNLLSNALKFTPEGGRIDVRAREHDGVAEVSVTDTGVGIAPEDQEVVFQEFRQVGTAAKKVEGTGLGLALCRRFVELHGGRIWVKSRMGHGSTFSFTLPVRREVLR